MGKESYQIWTREGLESGNDLKPLAFQNLPGLELGNLLQPILTLQAMSGGEGEIKNG